MTKLWEAIGEIDDLVFVCDKHESIRKALSSVFPNDHHRACIFHLSQNLRHYFKHEKAHKLYSTVAKAYRVPEFNCLMAEIYKVDAEVGNYLHSVGYEKWTRAYFDGTTS